MQPDPGAAVAAWERALLDAVRAVRFGSVEVVIHDGRVTHVERREKLRFDADGRLPDRRWRHADPHGRADWNTGRSAGPKARESEE